MRFVTYTMPQELYFDISSENSGGSLFRVTNASGQISFLYNHSTYNDSTGDVQVFNTPYASFEQFWKELTKDKEWFYLHPLYVHPEQRAFVQEQLKGVNWQLHPNKKWQESHQRQWKKVLTDAPGYYRDRQ